MATSPPKEKKKVWYKDPVTLGVAGVGSAAGLYVLVKNRGKGAGTGEGTDVSSTGAIPGAPYSSLGTDFYNAIEDSTSALQDKLSGLQQSVQDVNLQISKLPIQKTTPTKSQPHPRNRFTAIWRGRRIKKPTTLRQLAASVSASKNPAAISSTLDALIQRNPSLYKRYGANKPLRVGSVALIPTWK